MIIEVKGSPMREALRPGDVPRIYGDVPPFMAAGGFTSREIIRGVRIAGRDGFSGFDVVEVSPDFDTASGTTSVLAARLMAEALCCLAAQGAGRQDAWRTANFTGQTETRK